MALLERYLAAIERALPTAQAADIKAELRDVLLSRIEDQEARLGRPLTSLELEVLLVDFGHPLVVAGRYRKVQHLIGPEVFPFWWSWLRTTLAIVAGVYVVLIIVEMAAGGHHVLDRRLPSMWMGLLIAFAVVTLVGVAMEFYPPARVLQKWRPSELPPPGRKGRSPFEIAGEIAMGVVFGMWWIGFIHFRNWLPIPSYLEVTLAPIWADYYWPILGYVGLEIGANLLALARPGATRLNNGLSVLRHVIGAAIIGGVLQAGHWVTITSPTLEPDVVATIERNFDLGLQIGLVVSLGVMAVKAVWSLWLLARDLFAKPAGATLA
ncbi:MAG: hypothetical protein ACREE0_17495 [Phenylobacterium sp.]